MKRKAVSTLELQAGDEVRFTSNAKHIDPFGYFQMLNPDLTYMVAENDGSMRGPIRIVFFHLAHKKQEEGWFHPGQLELVNSNVTEGWTL